jgi:hypothetical protein
MYGLPKDFDAAFLLNRKLEIVSFAEYTVYFGFADNVSVTVTSSFQHQIGRRDQSAPIQQIPLAESKLMQLIGHTVLHANGDSNGTLTITFDNDHTLRIFDDQPNYESYEISDGDRRIFV